MINMSKKVIVRALKDQGTFKIVAMLVLNEMPLLRKLYNIWLFSCFSKKMTVYKWVHRLDIRPPSTFSNKKSIYICLILNIDGRFLVTEIAKQVGFSTRNGLTILKTK